MQEQVKWLFSEWDVNDDGLVSQDEFKDCLSVVCNPAGLSCGGEFLVTGGQMSKEEVEQVLRAVDSRHSSAL